MPNNADAVDFQLSVAPNPAAPGELQELGVEYWEFNGVDPVSNQILWTHKTSNLDLKAWSGQPHYAAAAAVTASTSSFDCATCGEPLTLTSRQALSDARRGVAVECRACNGNIDERAVAILDPSEQARREQRAAKAHEAEAAHAKRAADSQAEQTRLEALERLRRAAIERKYPASTESDGGYALDQASLIARVGALAVIHAAENDNGLVHPVQFEDASFAPTSELSRELALAAWWADLFVIHPSSPSNAFVWDSDTGAELLDNVYIARLRFMAPGEGVLTTRLAQLARDLRESLRVESLWSTDRQALEALAQRLITEEAIRYFEDRLWVHGLPTPLSKHLELLRSHVGRAAAHFSLGHLFRMGWSAARDAQSAYARIQGMTKEKASTHGVNKFVSYIERGFDDASYLGEPFDEPSDFALAAVTDVVFRVVLGLNPMRAVAADVGQRLAGVPDEELRRACDERIPSRSQLIEWLRTSTSWEPDDFAPALARIGGSEYQACAPSCAHTRLAGAAYDAGRFYDRIVSRTGVADAAIVTAEATALANEFGSRGLAGDLLLAETARELGWRPERTQVDSAD